MKLVIVTAMLTCLAVGYPRSGGAQPPPPAGRSVQLHVLQDAAIAADPRLRTLPLQTAQSELRLRNIAVQRLPAVGVAGLAQYQSDVPTAPFTLPNGQPIFSPPKTTYDASARLDQRIFDPTVGARGAVERAQLAENQARVRTILFGLRQDVNDAFFAAASLQQRAAALAAAITDLEGRLRDTTARVRDGMALPADAAAIEATLLQRRQDEEELRANRRAALGRLAKLTAQPVSDDDVLELPDTRASVATARQAPEQPRARPEYDQFARTRDRLARQQAAELAQERPIVSAFGRVGYGRPGLNFISNQFETYGLGGVQIQWKAWTWGSAGREGEALAIQQQIVDADQAAFTRGLGTAIESDLATIDRLQSALTIDDRIINLRQEVDRNTQVRFNEGVVTASESLDRQMELLQARYAQAGHRVELAQASARFLTTLGLEVR
jgi:outer membrane protein TolC